MTDTEFRAFIAQARAEVTAELARLEALDWEAMDRDERATIEERRRGYIELRDSMATRMVAEAVRMPPAVSSACQKVYPCQPNTELSRRPW